MSNKSSPRRRSVANKRYDEDYEYYVPAVRSYSKGTKSESTADESENTDSQEVKRKRGRPPGNKMVDFDICWSICYHVLFL